MPIFNHDTADIWYTVDGDGPPVLLLHGWTCDSHDWIFQIPLLLDHGYQVVAPDHRGHGRSSAPSGSYRPEVLADDAAALLKHLNIESAIVFGHSMGTTVASALAVRHPGVVRALVMSDPVYHRTGEILKPFVAMVQGDDSPERAVEYISAVFYSPDTPGWMRTWHRRRALGTPNHVVTGCIQGMYGDEDGIGRKENATKYFKARKVPRLAVYRTEDNTATDRAIPLEGFDEIVLLEGAGHWPHQQKSEEFNRIVVAWLEKAGLLPIKPDAINIIDDGLARLTTS